MNNAVITFAIPFYGEANFLSATLSSTRAQTVSNWCAIVVDDCCPTPGIRELVESFNDPRITYTRNEKNLGLAGNWNRCIDLAETPLVTLLHGDDELMANYAETMLAAHARCPAAAAIFCGATIIDGKGKKLFSFRDYVKTWLVPNSKESFVLSGERGVNSLLKGNFIMCPTLCYKKSLFENLKFSDDWRMVLDLDFYIRAISQGAQFVGIPDIAYRYRRHSAQVTAECERNLRIFVEEVALWQQAAADARKREWHHTAKIADQMTIIKLQLLYYAMSDVARLEFAAFGKKINLLSKIL